MVFIIDGINFMPYIAYRGLKWQRSDMDSADSGRSTLDGITHRSRIATKIRVDVTCKPLTSEQVKIVLNAILPKFVKVRYYDPMYGDVTKIMYSNNNPVNYYAEILDGVELWDGITFPLVEQ